MFSVGNKIVYPMHGAGVIQEIKEQEILGQWRKYYILKLPYSDMNVMIPVESENSVGIRDIISQETLNDVIDLLSGESTSMSSNWNRRYRENMSKLKTGDILEVAEVVRNLVRVDRKKSLSAGERKMLVKAMQILVSEIILAGNLDAEAAEKLVDEAI